MSPPTKPPSSGSPSLGPKSILGLARNVELHLKKRLSVHRRMALGTWSGPDDPTIHGTLRIRAEPMEAYLAALREATGQRVTLTAAFAKASGLVLAEVPDANALIRWGRIYLRDRVDVFVHVAMTDPETGRHDLTGLTLRDVDTRPLVNLAADLDAAVERARADSDPSMRATRKTMRDTPLLLVRAALKGLSFVSYTLNLDPTRLGAPRDPFGGVGITNVGALGLDTAYVPLVPYAKVPLFIAMGAVETVPVVEGDTVVPGRMLSVHATADHRVVDGAHLADMARILRRVFADPAAAFGAIPSSPEPTP